MLTFKSPPLPLADVGTQCRKITRHTQLLGPESVQHGRIPQNSSQWAQANFRFRTNADAADPCRQYEPCWHSFPEVWLMGDHPGRARSLGTRRSSQNAA